RRAPAMRLTGDGSVKTPTAALDVAHDGPVHSRVSYVRALALTAALVLAATFLGGGADARPAPLGQDPVVAGQVYTGDFPDPTVLRVAATYYAYSTTTDNLNLPTLVSVNLRTWHAELPRTWSPRGDALPRAAKWSAGVETPDRGFLAT